MDAESRPTQKSGWGQIFQGDLLPYTLILILGVTLYSVDTFVISGIMPTIIRDLGGAHLYAWPITTYMIGAMMGAASAGPVKGRFGRRNGFLFAGGIFMLSNLAAAIAPNMESLIFFRLLQGVGGGLIISQSYGTVGDVYPPHLRTQALATISSIWGIATVFGPGFGGIFAQLDIWRGAFWALVPMTLLFCGLVWFRASGQASQTTKSRFPMLRLLLIAVAILSVGFSSQTAVAYQQGILVVLAIVLMLLVFKLDARATNRMFPTDTLIPGTLVGMSYWFVLFFTLTFIIAVLFVTLYLQVLHGLSPLVSAYFYAIMALSWSLGSLLVASFGERLAVIAIFTGGLFIVLGSLGFNFVAVSGPLWMIAICLFLLGTGIGISNNHVLSRTIQFAPPGQESLVASSVQAMRNLGLAFGSALAGLMAKLAGMGDEASADVLVPAMQNVYRLDLVFAGLALMSLIFFYKYYRQAQDARAAEAQKQTTAGEIV